MHEDPALRLAIIVGCRITPIWLALIAGQQSVAAFQGLHVARLVI